MGGPMPGERAAAGLLDLASRTLGGSVLVASDELFAAKENLITPGPPEFSPDAFGPRGKIYDGWETRRRREPGHDHAIVRLGCPGIVHQVVVDTAYFRGNYPPEISVEAVRADGYPSTAELAALTWTTLVPRAQAHGDSQNGYQVADRRRWTHLRLSIYPDGGVARFRAYGEVVPDPAFLSGTIDLAAAENGGRVLDCSDAFYSAPGNLLMPGIARVMSDGWENARRRGPGNDYVLVALAGPGRIRQVTVDTTCFVGNAPGWCALSAAGPDAAAGPGSAAGSGGTASGRPPGWPEILPRTRLQPDTRHRFAVRDRGPDDPGPDDPHAADRHGVDRVRLDVFPDGGLSRLRILGELTPAALDAAARRWLDTAG